MIICCILSSLGRLKYRYHFYNYEMIKIDKSTTDDIELFFLFISCLYIEKYFLNIKIHRHHLITYTITLISTIIILIINLNKIKLYAIIIIIVIVFLAQFIQAMNYSIAKKLNYHYFINMNFILFLIGLLGIIFIIIFNFIYVCIFEYKIQLFSIDESKVKKNGHLIFIY